MSFSFSFKRKTILLITLINIFAGGLRAPLVFAQHTLPPLHQFHESQANQDKQIRLISWNVYKFNRHLIIEDLNNLTKNVDIFFAQESMDDSETLNAAGFFNFLNLDFFSTFKSNDFFTGVMTAHNFPQVKQIKILSSGAEPITGTPKATGLNLITIQNTEVLLINTHALNFNFGSDFENQISDVSHIIKKFKGPIIWAGDFNTWSESRMHFLLNITNKLDLFPISFKKDLRFLKLDHIFVRGFEVQKAKILNHYYSSDHFPILVELKLNH